MIEVNRSDVIQITCGGEREGGLLGWSRHREPGEPTMSPTPSGTLRPGPSFSARNAGRRRGRLAAALHPDLRLMARRHLAREGRPACARTDHAGSRGVPAAGAAAVAGSSTTKSSSWRLPPRACAACWSMPRAAGTPASVHGSRWNIVMEHHRVERPPVERTLSVRGALSQLRGRKARQATIVELRFFDGLSMDEIAAQTPCRRPPSSANCVAGWTS